MENQKISWAFFGTSELSVIVLDELKSKGLIPKLIITSEDKPKGRKLLLTPPEAKSWADKEGVSVLQLKSLRNAESVEKIKSFGNFEFFLVASYGKIIPNEILDLPKHKTINIHPSLLPKLRGPSPIQSAILKETETGVSIIRLDDQVDHGPLLAQKKVEIDWPPYEQDLENLVAKVGASMVADLLPDLLENKIQEKEQDHSKATFCEKIKKSDGEINLNDSPNLNLIKIRAYHKWPGAFFFVNNKRIIVKRAHTENNELVIDRIVPEGKKEMDYKDYIRNFQK
ncbi:MAG: methionyl-tRNA formyltransferase [Parcubacteria group bacterium]